MASTRLQSADHRKLLDVVDRLRLLGISHLMSLPQIVVCGDQSAGKSSALEAISGMKFPTKDTLCTRFATEMILRRGETRDVRITIIPGENRSPDEISRLSQFEYAFDQDSHDLTGAVDAASIAMGISDQKKFSDDILRVEVQGPDQPHLTLVDLPGMYRSGNKGQSVSEAPVVVKMVRKYMAEERSIIVAVIAASHEYVLQDVMEHVEELDPQKVRTLGLITKPDMLPSGSDSEAKYIALAQNTDVHLRLGWHVLRNRDYASRDASRQERDAQEEQFFKTGTWASLSPRNVGVKSLVMRLQEVLRDLILNNIPGLTDEVNSNISQCETRLAELGVSRRSLQEQRRYLYSVGSSFTSLLTAALDGTYNDEFFGLAQTEEGYKKRLRAIVQNRLELFAEEIRTKGHAQQIIELDEEGTWDLLFGRRISRKDYVASVKTLMQRNRGRELPGTFNPLIVGQLFQAQCQPWNKIVATVLEDIFTSVQWTATAILEAVAIPETFGPLAAFITQTINVLDGHASTYAKEILDGFIKRHPITYNHYLTDNVQKAQAARRQKALRALFNQYMPHTSSTADDKPRVTYVETENIVNMFFQISEPDMGTYASELAVDYMQAYYKVATKNIVDDVGMHIVEERLLDKLPNIFNQEVVSDFTDEQIATLAGEKSDTAEERKHNTEKLAQFREALEVIKVLNTQRVVIRGLAGLPKETDDQTKSASCSTQALPINDSLSHDSASPVQSDADDVVLEEVPSPVALPPTYSDVEERSSTRLSDRPASPEEDSDDRGFARRWKVKKSGRWTTPEPE